MTVTGGRFSLGNHRAEERVLQKVPWAFAGHIAFSDAVELPVHEGATRSTRPIVAPVHEQCGDVWGRWHFGARAASR
jgi:hypothetical protein